MKQTDSKILNSWHCYCTIWEEDPSFFEKSGVPKGFCGFCENVGNLGTLAISLGQFLTLDLGAISITSGHLYFIPWEVGVF
jgi:hypothetical protein